MEQISHHPPISYFLIEGPDMAYKLSGWSLHTIKMGMTSANLVAQGVKEVIFADG